MREIRKRPAWPPAVLSVTAKAMKGDRQKCLDAVASDYSPAGIRTAARALLDDCAVAAAKPHAMVLPSLNQFS